MVLWKCQTGPPDRENPCGNTLAGCLLAAYCYDEWLMLPLGSCSLRSTVQTF